MPHGVIQRQSESGSAILEVILGSSILLATLVANAMYMQYLLASQKSDQSRMDAWSAAESVASVLASSSKATFYSQISSGMRTAGSALSPAKIVLTRSLIGDPWPAPLVWLSSFESPAQVQVSKVEVQFTPPKASLAPLSALESTTPFKKYDILIATTVQLRAKVAIFSSIFIVNEN